MNYENKSFAQQPTRYVSKGMRLECWVKERTAATVTYFFENDPDALYTKPAAQFDATYAMPGKR
jgi:hypothetical protein